MSGLVGWGSRKAYNLVSSSGEPRLGNWSLTVGSLPATPKPRRSPASGFSFGRTSTTRAGSAVTGDLAP